MWAHSVWSQNTTTGGLRPQMFAPRSSGDGSEQGAADGVPAEGPLWPLSGSSGGLGSEARASSLVSLLQRALIPSRGTHPHDPSNPTRLPRGWHLCKYHLGGVGLQQMDLGGTQFSPLHTAVGNFCKDSRRQGPGVEAFLSAPRTVGQSEMHRGGV